MARRQILSFVMNVPGVSPELDAVFPDAGEEFRSPVIGWAVVRRWMRIAGDDTPYEGIEPLIYGDEGCPEPAGDCDNFDRVEAS